ncbi:MAG: DUF6541 family protein [Actinophytocola sp.]|uniref:DUF6541 family protein n=1 Tax=Actinophytocola sp. TaxID=1872138 RepID=UPI003C710A1A
MNWLDVAPIVFVTVGWLWLPGLPVTLLLGLRGIAAVALAPVVSIAVVASTAVGAELVGVGWSVLVPLAASAVLAVAAFFVRRRAFAPDPLRLGVVAAVGLAPAVLLATVSVMRAIGPPDSISQVFDTPFHYNALAYIRDTHQASSLTIGSLGNPDLPGVFYPAAWHDFGSLVMMSTGASVPVAANVLCAVVTVLLWPLSCLLLARQLFGRNTAAMAITGVLSVAFPAFPWDLFGWGVLWPNLFGMTLAPAVFALVLTVTGWVRDDAIGTRRAWVLLAVAVVATGFAHPNVLFSLVALSLFPVGARLFLRARQGRRGVVEFVVFAVVVIGGWLWSATSPAFAKARNWDWKAVETPANAVGEVLLGATNHREALWLLSAVVVVGMCTVKRFPAMRWVLGAHAVTALLYVLAAGLNRPDTRMLTGYWYNDSHRLAAMLPITGVPLAIAGILFIATAVKTRVNIPRPAIVLTAVLVVLTGGLHPADRELRIMVTYPRVEEHKLVTDDMRDFYERTADEIPAGSRVIGNPFDGSVLLWALADREVLFPHFLAATSPGQAYLGRHLEHAASDPRVCRELARYHVDHVLIGKDEANTIEGRFGGIPGVTDADGFELVAREGETRLYRITACDRHP